MQCERRPSRWSGRRAPRQFKVAAFSSNKIDIEFDAPVGGKVKFTATPKDASSGAFFMKVKMLP